MLMLNRLKGEGLLALSTETVLAPRSNPIDASLTTELKGATSDVSASDILDLHGLHPALADLDTERELLDAFVEQWCFSRN
uniref:Uncharacterized protein n=1 Tax=Cucumis melo TaxID=3656 RepID=A0A9I9EKQ4_CUCME